MNAGDLEYPTSGWVDPIEDPLPPIDAELVCDVAVVGGGYTGMSAALRLAERGIDVALVESGFCGRGASSRNAGHLTPTIAGDPQILATVYRKRASELVRVADRAVHFTEDLIERLGIECDYEATGNVSAALTAGQFRRSRRIVQILRGCGAEVEFVDGREFGLPDVFLGGILESVGGLLDPGKLARGMRDALLASGARVFEQSAVDSVETTAGGVVVRAGVGRLKAKQVLLATNAYSRDISFAPRRAVCPVRVTLAETEPIDPRRFEEIGWSSRSGVYTQHLVLENYRPTARNSVVFGTRRVEATRGPLCDHTPNPAVVDDIIRGFRERFCMLGDVEVEKAWCGWIAMTPSWLPVVGNAASRVTYAFGYNGHGAAQAPYVGFLVADLMAGDDLHDDLRVLWRERPRFAPTPLFNGPTLRLASSIDRTSDRIARNRT